MTAANSSPSYYGATKEPNGSDLLIHIPSKESVRSERANKSDDNRRDGTPSPIGTIERRRLQKSRKIIIESNSNESDRDKRSNAKDIDTKGEDLEKSIPVSRFISHVHRFCLIRLP